MVPNEIHSPLVLEEAPVLGLRMVPSLMKGSATKKMMVLKDTPTLRGPSVLGPASASTPQTEGQTVQVVVPTNPVALRHGQKMPVVPQRMRQ